MGMKASEFQIRALKFLFKDYLIILVLAYLL